MSADPTTHTGVLFPSTRHRLVRPRRRSIISLTPLIDVVFILLIFFMLATTLEQWNAITLDSPASRTVSGSSMEGAFLIEVRPDGLRVAGTAITPDALVARVRERLRTKPDQRFLVRPEPRVPLQATVDVLDRVTGAGAQQVSMIRRGRK